MQSTSSEAQVTQSGQAIAINNITCKQLQELFAPIFGPNGSTKALFGGSLTLTKDGSAICTDIKFTHPTSVFLTRAAATVFNNVGDGTTTFVLLCTEIFTQAFKFYSEGANVTTIINSLQLAVAELEAYVQSKLLPLDEEKLQNLIFNTLKTKIRNPGFLVEIISKAVKTLPKASFDTNMIEIIKMNEGDVSDSFFVDGLVLDHGPRHHLMPTHLENACVLIMNMSLEYEKPEVNSEFCYSSAKQREELALAETMFIKERAKLVAELAVSLKKENKSLLVISEKGIDPSSLEILAEAGVCALRRAKRRNLERLLRIVGGSIVTQPSQINKDFLGFCKKVSVRSVGEDKFTILEGTPMKGACTILIRGSTDFKRIQNAIKGTILSVSTAMDTNQCIYGGKYLYRNIALCLREKAKGYHEADSYGFEILAGAFENLIKVLIRNEGKNVHQEFVKVMRECKQEVIENIRVVAVSLKNAYLQATYLLMCDEIILAGKSIKQEGN